MTPNEKLTYIARRGADLYEERSKRMAVEEVQEEWLTEERRKSVRRDRAQFAARFSSGTSQRTPPAGPDSDFEDFFSPAEMARFAEASRQQAHARPNDNPPRPNSVDNGMLGIDPPAETLFDQIALLPLHFREIPLELPQGYGRLTPSASPSKDGRTLVLSDNDYNQSI
ncbi:hypothetical protein KC19_VG024100 [Ceratodon purpureus]|uniref:Uncharacterized protein n=1 Tax=Ceratodon purpureus TaxID=3225 RepID=A0A8T0HL87_CERPU|nr:hypothetical protein KC19_VG024100 [Ceratodon purpureus]